MAVRDRRACPFGAMWYQVLIQRDCAGYPIWTAPLFALDDR